MRSADDNGSLGPVIRDRRRIDPVTGQARDGGRSGAGEGGQGQSRPGKHSASKPGGPAGGGRGAGGPAGGASRETAAAPDGGSADRPAAPAAAGTTDSDAAQAADAAKEAAARLAERTADLQRLQAEYANYRKRVERDRMAVREQALANVLSALLPVLDDIGRAREHGELEGGFRAVAEALEAATVKLGLSTYGENGDPFDPNVHEALMHSYSEQVTEPTCVQILQPGYKVSDRILRPARVAVAEPGHPAAEPAAAASAPGASAPGASAPGGPGADGPADPGPGDSAPAQPAGNQDERSSGRAESATGGASQDAAGRAGDPSPDDTD